MVSYPEHAPYFLADASICRPNERQKKSCRTSRQQNIKWCVSGGAVIPVVQRMTARASTMARRQGKPTLPKEQRSETTHPKKNTQTDTSCGEHESQNTPKRSQGRGFCGGCDAAAAHGTRAGGAVGSAAPAGAHEAGARPGEETARKGGRRREIRESATTPKDLS